MGSTMSIFTEKGAEVRDLGTGLSLRLGLQKSTKRFSFVSLLLSRRRASGSTVHWRQAGKIRATLPFCPLRFQNPAHFWANLNNLYEQPISSLNIQDYDGAFWVQRRFVWTGLWRRPWSKVSHRFVSLISPRTFNWQHGAMEYLIRQNYRPQH